MQDNVLIKFGERVRELRLEKALSQEKLAELAKCHRNYIGYIERGERKVSLKKVLLLLNALDCDANTLLTGLEQEISEHDV